jgi:hypothetical protein
LTINWRERWATANSTEKSIKIDSKETKKHQETKTDQVEASHDKIEGIGAAIGPQKRPRKQKKGVKELRRIHQDMRTTGGTIQ